MNLKCTMLPIQIGQIFSTTIFGFLQVFIKFPSISSNLHFMKIPRNFPQNYFQIQFPIFVKFPSKIIQILLKGFLSSFCVWSFGLVCETFLEKRKIRKYKACPENGAHTLRTDL